MNVMNSHVTEYVVKTWETILIDGGQSDSLVATLNIFWHKKSYQLKSKHYHSCIQSVFEVLITYKNPECKTRGRGKGSHFNSLRKVILYQWEETRQDFGLPIFTVRSERGKRVEWSHRSSVPPQSLSHSLNNQGRVGCKRTLPHILCTPGTGAPDGLMWFFFFSPSFSSNAHIRTRPTKKVVYSCVLASNPPPPQKKIQKPKRALGKSKSSAELWGNLWLHFNACHVRFLGRRWSPPEECRPWPKYMFWQFRQ